MSPEAQRIAIAEACGWKWKSGHFTEWGATEPLKQWHDPNGKAGNPTPDFLNDLNAIRLALHTLTTWEQMGKFAVNLCQEVLGVPDPDPMDEMQIYALACATAEQYAKAFLKTIGKWDDSK